MTGVNAGIVAELRRAGVARGDLLALAMAPEVGLAMVAPSGSISFSLAIEDPASVVGAVEDEIRPRWVWWSNEVAVTLVNAGIRVATCWDIAAVHRLLFGGWRADSAHVWAQIHQMTFDSLPTSEAPNLFTFADHEGDVDDPLRSDGYLRPEWASGAWSKTPERLLRWAELAKSVVLLQQEALGELTDRPMAGSSARSESVAELLCAELSADGLPMDRAVAEEIVRSIVGVRPRSEAEAIDQRAVRDAEVLRHVPGTGDVDLRSPGQVRALLERVGIIVPDTRAWRLTPLRDAHPLVASLLAWRKAERVATTYGYRWLDEHLDLDGRLRGTWSGSDGAAGRMTASNGLHNMPADMRAAVVAEAGHVFVRADLGQVEPRVLAAISGDRALAAATLEDDMYAPVAEQLAVNRATAKVAVLGAMYGQTTGEGARALRRLEAAYPVAMAYLEQGARFGEAGRDLRTYGGRLISFGNEVGGDVGYREAQSLAAARGRYGRNALVQGAAAELFKIWALTVRARGADLGAQVVLCLHDELLIHVPDERRSSVTTFVDACLQEAVRRWAPDESVRFLADISVIRRWSDAKEGDAPRG